MPETVHTRFDSSGVIVSAPAGISISSRTPRRIEKHSAATLATGAEKTSATSFVSIPSPFSGKPANSNESGIASTKNSFSLSDDLPLELAQRTTSVPRPIGSVAAFSNDVSPSG